MAVTNRIPACTDNSFDGMLMWFAQLSKDNLLFHPDDDPASIVFVASGKRFFTRSEVNVLRRTIAEFFKANGERVYDAAYPVFMKKFGHRLDA